MPGKLFHIFFCGCMLLIAAASAQNPDTAKVENNKIDTALLNRYRITPRRNAIPVRSRPPQIRPVYVPVIMPNYELNYWRKSITMSVNFSQSAFTSNYAAGGVSAAALNANFIYRTEYKKDPFNYTAEINFLYGISKNKGQGSRKTNDRIFIDNKIATKLSDHWFFFGALSFESQFDRGYQYTDLSGQILDRPILLSRFMAPGYFTESIGFEYKPATWFSMRFGTGTARQTFVLDTIIYRNNPANYGVAIGKTFRNDLAFQIVSQLDKDIFTNVHLNARYALFIPYEKPLDFVTHRVDAILTAKVNRLISVTINGTFLYDKTTSKQVQGTEGMALGIIYRFP
jgi:hypothetical protein